MEKMELVVLLLAILAVMVIIRLKRKKTPSHKEKAANKNISLRKRGIRFWIFSLPKIFVVGIFANPIWRKYGLLTFFSQEFSFWERRRINKILEKFGVERRSSGLCLIPNSRMDLLGFIANQLIYTKKPKNYLAAKKFAKRAQEEIMNNQIDSLEKYKSMVAVITAYKKLFEAGICEETDFIAACTIQICIGEMLGQGLYFDHSWIELDGQILDIAISMTLLGGAPVSEPIVFGKNIRSGKEPVIKYGVPGHGIEGETLVVNSLPFIDYMDGFPDEKNGLWGVVQELLGRKVDILDLREKYKNVERVIVRE